MIVEALSNMSVPAEFLLKRVNPEHGSTSMPCLSHTSHIRLTPRESDDMCPEITMLTLCFLASSMWLSGKCIPTTVPTPAWANFS